jgi:hypothetical protein
MSFRQGTHPLKTQQTTGEQDCIHKTRFFPQREKYRRVPPVEATKLHMHGMKAERLNALPRNFEPRVIKMTYQVHYKTFCRYFWKAPQEKQKLYAPGRNWTKPDRSLTIKETLLWRRLKFDGFQVLDDRLW